MLLTKECDYGIRIIRALSDGTQKTVKAMCEPEHIPHKYAYGILKKLQKAGMVQNRRGPNGGYVLIKPLHTFGIYDIITAIDERLFLSACLQVENFCRLNSREYPCAVHLELMRLQNLLLDEMKAKSMAELMNG